ncbi:MAG: L-asparaginase 1 [Balneola sp.]|jgi:L-asparaginase|nr:L-asparaginase 1 [Balneola sp.]MBE80248.1 L-asparaginase 1 [Balneola sp.]HBX65820.1 asparaginase [Balneolaceae bacterium]|tara:strand:- start:603 stop:1592 length:990 start_codon:yes stop_codon:yes gene_type:complete
MKKNLLIQTGGTIAMNAKGEGVELNPEKWSKVLYDEIPELNEIAEITTLPLFFEDSSDLNASHWIELAACIEENYSTYNGFVILHGTDTMAYSASALSFGLKNLGKPVIFTGSQLPMSTIRSDARRNLVNAIELATMDFKEVGICFNDALYRGNRSTKLSIGDFDAFGSPNCSPLADIGIQIEALVQHSFGEGEFENQAKYSDEVFVLTAHPNMNPELLNGLDLSKIRAVVLRAFGSGNFCVKGEKSLLPFLDRCKEHDVVVAIVSQADYDSVDLSQYSAGRAALKHGAISGNDLTLEAAVTKLMFLLAHYDSKTDIEERFQQSLVGEL